MVARKKTIYAMSRHRRNLIIAAIIVCAALLVLLDHGILRNPAEAPRKSDIPAEVNDVEKYHGKIFTVVNVVDGDTLDINVPDGKNSRTRIRLLGIDAPEITSENPVVRGQGEKAAEFVRQVALGKPVTVYLDRTGQTRGKYGRLIAYLKLPDGTFLNEILLGKGYVYADLRFRNTLIYKYRGLESVARGQRRGVWENPTLEQLPEWLREKNPAWLRKK